MSNFPHIPGDHPETDKTDIVDADQISIHEMIMGSAHLVITPGKFDIQYATNTLARFAQKPREGHMKRAIRLFWYLKYNPKAKLFFDPTYFDHNNIKFENQE